MRVPSGDHTGPEAPLGRSVIIEASPPASESIASCAGFGLPASSFSPPRNSAIWVPSGDHRGGALAIASHASECAAPAVRRQLWIANPTEVEEIFLTDQALLLGDVLCHE